MIPIAIPMGIALDLELALVIGAAISGGVFGDHCSPISDTSIMSSTGSAADHMEHIRTQLPYAMIIGLSASAGFLMSGLTQSSILGIITTAAVLVAILMFVKNRMKRRNLGMDE